MERVIRQLLLRLLTGERAIVLTRTVPSREELRAKLESIDALGLYLHIPFCEQICPYCPYNKELYRDNLAERYVDAVKTEMDFYADIVGDKPITSLYIGGGTPTTMLDSGLGKIIGHIRDVFNLQCDIHMESHPNHLSAGNLGRIKAMGVQHLSLGVEALFDRHLKFLCRPYTADGVKEAVRRAVSAGFKCVNVDVMFALPGQTYGEIEETGRELVKLGVDQVAAYPLFRFPYTPLGKAGTTRNHVILQSLKRRRMLRILENIFYRAGYERTSVWAFTRRGVPRYCSVTVPLYLGLGASGGSYLKDVFYLNTFGVAEYINAIEASWEGRRAVPRSDGENAASGLAVLADLRDQVCQGRLSGEIRRGYRPRVRRVFAALETARLLEGRRGADHLVGPRFLLASCMRGYPIH